MSPMHRQGSFLLMNNKTMQDNNILVGADELIQSKKAACLSKAGEKTNSLEFGKRIIEQRRQSLGPNVSCFYAKEGGLVVREGVGCYMIDMDGNHYLDCCNNVACVGHSNPRVVQAGATALSQIQTNSRFLHPDHHSYINKLLKTFPSELNTVYLVNSGSEANDLALRIAKAHAEEEGISKEPHNVICLDSAYHGHTQSLVDISPYKWYQSVNGKNYQPSSTHVASLPDTFRGKFRGTTGSSTTAYANEVENIVKSMNGVGVFVAESIVGCGGQIVLPPDYLSKCYKAVRAKGGVCIADEVQTGFGRSGTHFWQFQTYGVTPDIVTFGKPMGNGYPVAGLVCKRSIADSFASSGIEYFNTYGGNNVACSIGEAVLDVIADDNLMEKAKKTGDYLMKHLLDLQNSFDWIGDVRGQGLFLGVEFVIFHGNGEIEPFAELAKFVVDYLRFDHVIISRDGPDHNVIKIKPPLVFGQAEADIFLASLRSSLVAAKSLIDD